MDIVLFVDRFQFRMETANDHILEAVSLNTCPVLHLIGWDILNIAGDIITCESIGSVTTDECHQFVVFVGNIVLGSQL